jgi:hypothetical protein
VIKTVDDEVDTNVLGDSDHHRVTTAVLGSSKDRFL